MTIATTSYSLSVIVPCKNEVGTINNIIRKIPTVASNIEVVFVDGHSTDGTYELLTKKRRLPPWVSMRVYTQPGMGKWDAVSYGLRHAHGDIRVIYDADMSLDLSVLSEVFSIVQKHPDALVTGSRFIYPQEKHAMQFLNHTGNILFSWIFSRMLHMRITDTLCGTKAMTGKQFDRIWKTTKAFRVHDPYGDFTLLLGAAKLHMPIIELPVQYRARVYGETKIHRFRDGAKLVVVLFFAIRDFFLSN
jgi:glycosyltransferase involved in cell wall biosynthesis